MKNGAGTRCDTFVEQRREKNWDLETSIVGKEEINVSSSRLSCTSDKDMIISIHQVIKVVVKVTIKTLVKVKAKSKIKKRG